MKEHRAHHFRKIHTGITLGLIVLLMGFGTYSFYTFSRALDIEKGARAESDARLEAALSLLTEKISLTENGSVELSETLASQKEEIASFKNSISSVSESVGTLEKLRTLDPELLQKYSKVYFLSENYVPSSLATIDKAFVLGDRTLQIHASVVPFLDDLFEAQADAGLHLVAVSAYRSFGTQAALKSNYRVLYGSGANTFSADQGYSEHQLGTTLDLSTSATGDLTTSFESSPEFKWLSEHAFQYGFILSYPKNNTYYVYEPWHWRFVGIALATKLHEEGKYLFNLAQRDIDEYLVGIFDHH